MSHSLEQHDHPRQSTAEDAETKPKSPSEPENPVPKPNPRDDVAAAVIQKHWRRRTEQKVRISSDERWKDAALHIRMELGREALEKERNDPKSRWQRAIFLAGRLGDGQAAVTDHANEPSVEKSKVLETQHWLELIDAKHRYGSNLKYYHQKWQQDDTSEPFFRWLDRGGGKDLSLPECSREQLEKQRIRYLSAEQRLNYLVKIDEKGLLRWARNNELVDTSANKWKDGGSDVGVVPMTKDEIRGKADVSRNVESRRQTIFGPISRSSPTSSEEEAEARHYAEVEKTDQSKIKKIWSSRFTTHGLTERLLRKTVRKNTWIYTCDTKFNIFVGIKESGTFQHSSFTCGGLVSSAGLITVKNGRIRTLTPLSGHYRTSVDHFRQFIEELDKRGADLHKVKITKAEMILWGIEHIAKIPKVKEAVKDTVRGGSVFAHRKKKQEEEDERWRLDDQWRKDIVLGRTSTKDDGGGEGQPKKEAESPEASKKDEGQRGEESSQQGNA